jgi:hypothetical protein
MRVLAALCFALGEFAIKASSPIEDHGIAAIVFFSAAAVIWTISGER